jgi:hypothetical protein
VGVFHLCLAAILSESRTGATLGVAGVNRRACVTPIASRTPAFGALERCFAGVSAIKKNETQRHKAIASSYGHLATKRRRAPVPQSPASPGSVSQITQSPRVSELHFHLLVTDLASEGGSSWETAISPPRRRRTPARQRAKAQSAKRPHIHFDMLGGRNNQN